MATRLFDNVKVNIATTGQGTVTFGAKVSDAFQTPAEAGAADNDIVPYILREGNDWEEGDGTVGGSVTTMTRTVRRSSIGGTVGTTKLTLAGTATLALIAGADDIVTRVPRREIAGSASITKADWGRTIYFNSASDITVTIDAVATLTDGFWCRFKNINSGVVTLDPNSSETIDGETTIIVPKGDSGELHCTGSVLHTMERPSIVKLHDVTFNNTVATYDFSLPGGFKSFDIRWQNLVPQTTSRNFNFQTSSDGTTFDTGASDYLFNGDFGSGYAASSNNNALGLVGLTDNTSGIGSSGQAHFNPGKNSGAWPTLVSTPFYYASGAKMYVITAVRQSNYRAKAIRLMQNSTGNIAEGAMQIYGLR